MPVEIGERLLKRSLTILRRCGAGRRECIVFWLSSADRLKRVVEVVHLPHTAVRGACEIDGRELTALWQRLAHDHLRIIVQVHTHPGAAYHSSIDDQFPILPTPGLLSLVLPDFAASPIDPATCFLARLESDGGWTPLDPKETLTWNPR